MTSHLPPRVLAALAERGVARQVRAGTLLYREGDDADGMYLLEEGTVEVHLGASMPSRILTPGALLGEIALLAPGTGRTATVTVATDGVLKFIDRATFEGLLRSDPELALAAFQHACESLLRSERHLVGDLRRRNAELEAALDFLRRTREELDEKERMAQTDALTGLYNRRCLDAQLPRFIERARRDGDGLALLVIDLDGFKPVNDTHGHAAGDAVLREVGAILRSAVRPADLPCRLGGDEFAVLIAPLERLASEGAGAIASRLRRDIASREVPGPEGPLRVGATIGGTTCREGDDAATLLARADSYLYAAKEAGRNRVAWEGRVLGDAPPADN